MAIADAAEQEHTLRLRQLIMGALGVVYGDIGTSPLYAFKQCLGSGVGTSEASILGVLSLIAWTLFLVVTVKYVLVILRADNRGEGGILALTALALRATKTRGLPYFAVMGAGMFGAALFYGDGVITPAISVLSAVEGLKIATPLFEPYVLPIALVLLVGLFVVQRSGTAKVGRLFGPVMLLWFGTLGALGIAQIVINPHVLLALNPAYGIAVLMHDPAIGFALLGSVVLAVTGAEALYADMGHFGKKPIRIAWLYCCFPALILNYFGQGALVLRDITAVENPFYLLAPEWGLYPLVLLSASATVIASQAMISGAFSVTRQAMQLGYLPRLQVLHTSEEEIGQVYLPKINLGLAIGVIALVLSFRSSDALAAAYGIAVTGTMLITTVLSFVYFRGVLRLNLLLLLPVFAFFLTIDGIFLSSNLLKVADGGWFPLVVAGMVATVMTTWWRGRRALGDQRIRDALSMESFVRRLKPGSPGRIAGTAVFMTGNPEIVPGSMLHTLKHFKVLHERVVLMKVETEDIPHVPYSQRLDVTELENGFWTVKVHYGFMDQPDVLRALAQCRRKALAFDLMETSFIVGREKLIAAPRQSAISRFRKQLFILMSNNMLDATEFFRIPSNRVVEVGGQVEI